MRVVITGTSRGIGLELAGLALAAGHDVIAVARAPDESPGLQALAARSGDRLRLVAGDVTQPGTHAAVASAAAAWGALDVLVNNAGILRKGVARGDFVDSFLVNAVAPFELTRALLPLLQQGDQPRAVHITSMLGSITDNTSGGYYSYRASKAALNMLNKSLSVDQPWLTCLVIHPGWVQTAMGGAKAPLPVRESAIGIWKIAGNPGAARSGQFLDYRGRTLPW